MQGKERPLVVMIAHVTVSCSFETAVRVWSAIIVLQHEI